MNTCGASKDNRNPDHCLEGSCFTTKLYSHGCGGLDLNKRPLGYEPSELPDCSTPHYTLCLSRDVTTFWR